ncbi:MAG: hypothetical protein FWD55_02550 [Propionibacteriaceae bacterium]|nr:hypothetical protein [Propionibacteriaceae bacterium]
MRYLPGQWFGIICSAGCVALPPQTSHELAVSLWAGLKQGENFPQIMQRIVNDSGVSLTLAPSFALALFEDSSVHVAVRGDLYVEVKTPSGPVRIDGSKITTWREEIIVDPQGLTLVTNSQAEDAFYWPLYEGVARVSVIEMAGPPTIPSADMAAASVVKPATPPAVPSPPAQAVVPPPAVPAGANARAPVDEPQTPAEENLAPRDDHVTLMPDDMQADNSSQAEPEAVQADSSPGLGQVAAYGVLPGDDGQSADDEDDPHHTTLYRSFFEEPGAPDSSQADGSTVPHRAIQQVSQPEQSPEDLDDHDGMTVMSVPGPAVSEPASEEPKDLAAAAFFALTGPQPPSDPSAAPQGPPASPMAAQPAPSPSSAVTMVSARICVGCGTPNSTRLMYCRTCDATLEGDAVQIPRPVLGRVRLPNGEVRSIDQPMVIGRRPEAARFSNADIPALITVDDSHISGTHLRVDLEDWSVMVTSLGRNGTILRRKGKPDRRLTDGQQELARNGDVFFLSKDLTMTIEELV